MHDNILTFPYRVEKGWFLFVDDIGLSDTQRDYAIKLNLGDKIDINTPGNGEIVLNEKNIPHCLKFLFADAFDENGNIN